MMAKVSTLSFTFPTQLGDWAPKPDPISVGKTHSATWLWQCVCQIVTTLKWEEQFTCEGLPEFADFKAVVESVNEADPGSYVFRSPVNGGSQNSVREFARKMDTVLDLLDATADPLAVEWDSRMDGVTDAEDRGGDSGRRFSSGLVVRPYKCHCLSEDVGGLRRTSRRIACFWNDMGGCSKTAHISGGDKHDDTTGVPQDSTALCPYQ
jgi:hypothetical protein